MRHRHPQSSLEPVPAPLPKDELEYVGLLAGLAGNEIADNDVNGAIRINRVVRWCEEHGIPAPPSNSGRPSRSVPISVIAPGQPIGSSTDFDPNLIRQRWTQGEALAEEWLDGGAIWL